MIDRIYMFVYQSNMRECFTMRGEVKEREREGDVLVMVYFVFLIYLFPVSTS